MKPKDPTDVTGDKTTPTTDPVITLLAKLTLAEGTKTIFTGEQDLEIDTNKPTVIVVVGVSGGGKDTITGNLHKNTQRVRTATTRKRRFKANKDKFSSEENLNNFITYLNSMINLDRYLQLLDLLHEQGYIDAEPSDAYTWLPWLSADSNTDDYVEKHGLVEHDFHYGNLYGVPKANLDEVIKSGNVPVVLTEINGYKSLENLLKGQYNILLLNILPDDMETVINSIKQRSDTTTDGAIEQRIQEDKDLLRESTKITHFHILNSRIKGSITETQAEVVQLLQYLGVL